MSSDDYVPIKWFSRNEREKEKNRLLFEKSKFVTWIKATYVNWRVMEITIQLIDVEAHKTFSLYKNRKIYSEIYSETSSEHTPTTTKTAK